MRDLSTQSGACKLCSWPFEGELNRKIRDAGFDAKDRPKFNAAMAERWAKDKYDFAFTRQTYYKHLDHIRHPADKYVAASHKPRADGELIRSSSNDDLLQAVIDLGMQRIEADPGSVSIDHALKAVQIRESRREKGQDMLLVFAKIVTGQGAVAGLLPAPAVEGEFAEIEA